MKQRVVSGMRPSGRLHIGHYHGVLENWVKMQDSYDCFFFVADWHSLTTEYADTSGIAQSTRDMVLDWVAFGLDPEKCVVFRQSLVPHHSELNLILSMITPVSWLERNPTYKEMLDNIEQRDLTTFGFLGYPVLMAADIILYKATRVPVGQDQLPHLEITREIARRFNHLYGQVFPEPEALLTETPKLPGLDGRKMSKSYNNYIAFNDTPRDIFGKVMSIPDNMIVRYFRYGARASEKDIKEMEEQLKSDSFNPRDAKVKTAKAIVAIYHGDEAGENALAEFDKIFKNKDIPDEIEEMKLDLPTAVQPLMDVLVLTNLVPSKKEAKRLIEQGGVMLDGEKITDFRAEIDLSSERLLKVGKRIFLKVKG